MIRSVDFYQNALQKIKANSQFTFIKEEVLKVEETPQLSVFTSKSTYTCKHIFDSRIPKEYFQEQKCTKIHQHFKGWMIETETPVFNPAQFTMMDYRLKYKNATSFTYVLPISATKAFIEYTFFTPFTTEEKVYDEQLQKYIKNFLKIEDYKITETEQGNIPMTDFPFHLYHSENITKIGTAGGWVKGSTGYSFKHTEKKVARILENIIDNRMPSEGLSNKKFLFYDKIFLNVLEQENEKGEWIFEQFYAKNSIQEVFRYLDEETVFAEDLKIMGSLLSSAFVRAFFKSL
jgi:lycopene beta-cyclase